jgi:aminoglycoside phosphotransferase (APT) family kinase protein
LNLQCLFNEPIEIQEDLGGHASDIWLIKTMKEEVIVRASGVRKDTDVPFLYGCRNMFGIELSRTFDQELVNKELSLVSPIPIPQVLRKQTIDDVEFIVVNKMEGEKRNFIDTPTEILESLGRDLAYIHKKRFFECGNIKGDFRYPIFEFNKRLAQVIDDITSKYYRDQSELFINDDIIQELVDLPAPPNSSYVMVDLDSRQMLFDDHRITAIVDTEAYVIGPRELDLITLECSLSAEGAKALKKGYESVDVFPDLIKYRKPYRYFFALLQVKGPFNYIEWINTPNHFDCNSGSRNNIT